jgi:hypothetical protein
LQGRHAGDDGMVILSSSVVSAALLWTWSLQNRGNAIHSGTPGWWYVFTLSKFLFGL